ncbi:hypothetical protein M422DRAFT_247717 [Sphaerobolus stellatus SS14]|nr:hypothetical protein M422DRAFT_247717 [Sphaerobolus stellatus SS14]
MNQLYQQDLQVMPNQYYATPQYTQTTQQTSQPISHISVSSNFSVPNLDNRTSSDVPITSGSNTCTRFPTGSATSTSLYNGNRPPTPYPPVEQSQSASFNNPRPYANSNVHTAPNHGDAYHHHTHFYSSPPAQPQPPPPPQSNYHVHNTSVLHPHSHSHSQLQHSQQHSHSQSHSQPHSQPHSLPHSHRGDHIHNLNQPQPVMVSANGNHSRLLHNTVTCDDVESSASDGSYYEDSATPTSNGAEYDSNPSDITGGESVWKSIDNLHQHLNRYLAQFPHDFTDPSYMVLFPFRAYIAGLIPVGRELCANPE